MRIKLFKLLLPLLLLITSPAVPETHLILYFDMNKTLIASDKNAGKTSEQLILEEIASKVSSLWDNTLNSPISYLDYVNHYLIPNPDQQPTIREQQITQISNVLYMLRETNHPDYLTMQSLYDQAIARIEKIKQNNTQIFPSFYRLIEHLKKNNISYTLIIRTFGSESPEIIQELNQYLDVGFNPTFLKIGQLENFLDDIACGSDHPLVIQDDFSSWKTHHKHWKYGKPFPIHNTPSLISLFFDDNAKIDPYASEENIVFPYDAITGTPIHPSIAIEQGLLIPVSMLEALLDEEYYIEKIPAAQSVKK